MANFVLAETYRYWWPVTVHIPDPKAASSALKTGSSDSNGNGPPAPFLLGSSRALASRPAAPGAGSGSSWS